MELTEVLNIALMQGFAGLSLFAVLLLMGLGLAIIFGQMGVINMAHGEFMAIGAYTVYLGSTLTEKYAPGFMPAYFPFAIVAAFIFAFIGGWIAEWALIRHLYKRPLDTLLATWGLSLGLQQVFRTFISPKEVSPTLPDWLMGSWAPQEGLDIPTLDTIFLSTPHSDVKQAIGRILRGASRPVIWDIVDSWSVLYSMWRKRLAVYRELGIVIEGEERATAGRDDVVKIRCL
jgi:hypothetical protein